MNQYTYVFALLLTFYLLNNVRCDCFCSGNYSYPQHCVTDCVYQLEWCFNNVYQELNFQVTSNDLTRWMGVGFSQIDEGPQNSDLVLAWIDEHKRFKMNDVWVDDNFVIHSDYNQSIYNISAVSKNKLITYKFSRKLITNDFEHDFELDQCFHLLYPIKGGPIDSNMKPIKYIKHVPFIISPKICLKQCSKAKAIKELEASLAKLILSLMARVEKSVNISDGLPSESSTTSLPSITSLPTNTLDFNATLFDDSINVNEKKLMMAESENVVNSNKFVSNITTLSSATSLSTTISEFNSTMFEKRPKNDVNEIMTGKIEKTTNKNRSLISEIIKPLIASISNTSEAITAEEFEERKDMGIAELLRSKLKYIIISGIFCLLLLLTIMIIYLMLKHEEKRKREIYLKYSGDQNYKITHVL